MLVYTGLGAFSWLQHRKRNNKSHSLRTELLILSGALLVHGVTSMFPVLQDRVLVTDFDYPFSLIVWLMLMVYCSGSFFYCLCGVQLLLHSCAALTLLLGFLLLGDFTGRQIVNLLPLSHITSSLLACELFDIIALFAILILLINRSLHKHRSSTLVGFLPPLLNLEKPVFQGTWAGFVLLTYSVTSGVFFAEAVFDKPMTFTHRAIFSVISWLIYGASLLKRSMTTWRGKKAAVWTIVGSVNLIFVYIGSKFVSETILHRIG